jgi:hypothetical protein
MASVSIRRAVTAASTIVVAVVLALCVPLSQLQTARVVPDCCCPDPDKCKCPDHDPMPDVPSMRACHKNLPDVVTTSLAAFIAPILPSTIEPARVALLVLHGLDSPHRPPAPRRPDAPS